MPLPSPACGSDEAIWEEPTAAPRGFFKALFRPLEVFVQTKNNDRDFGINGYGLTAGQRTEMVRSSDRRFIKKWHCPSLAGSLEPELRSLL